MLLLLCDMPETLQCFCIYVTVVVCKLDLYLPIVITTKVKWFASTRGKMYLSLDTT